VTLILNAHDVEPLCNMPELIDIIERGLREEVLGKAVVPPRLNLPSGDGFLRVMPAVMNDSGLMGYKAAILGGGKTDEDEVENGQRQA
jgi:alanine dehydrogenase